VESRLGPDEKKAFTEAKRKALVPWQVPRAENDAWRPISRSKCPKGTIVPMRFLLRYKENQPHARVILQGFKHKDAHGIQTGHRIAYDLSSWQVPAGSDGMLQKVAHRHHGTKSAFLQSDCSHQEVEIYGGPSADVRRLLAEMMGSCKLPNQLLEMSEHHGNGTTRLTRS
jgi:hypothetical protein